MLLHVRALDRSGFLVFFPLLLGHFVVFLPIIRLIVLTHVNGDIVVVNNPVNHHLLVITILFPMTSVPLVRVPCVVLIVDICHILRMVMMPHGVRLVINLVRVVVMGIQMSMVVEFIMHPIKRTPPVNMKGWISQKRLSGSMIGIVSHTCGTHAISIVMHIQTPVIRRKDNFASAETTNKVCMTINPCPPIKPVIEHVVINNDWHILSIVIIAVSIIIFI